MLETQIEEAKKFNVALSAIKFEEHKWDDKRLMQVENVFKITLDDNDKKRFLKLRNRHSLQNELKNQKMHNSVINKIPDIFVFEQKKRNAGKDKEAPTKESAELLNESAELLGLLLRAFDIKTSQIRRYLDSLRRIKADNSIESFNASSVLLQQVKIAYAAGRNKDLDFLYEVMKSAITEGSKGYKCFEQLLRMVEAIVAYHKFYGGGD